MELPAARRRPWTAFALVAVAVGGNAGAAVGRTPGFASVSPLGEARYTVPIGVPPGTNGMTPAVSLEYRHRLRGGLLGIGWAIGGLSQITRCPRTIAQDGVNAPIRLNADDRFCLDGQRLVPVGTVSYFAPNSEYRTEIESFARVRAVQGSSANGPQYFIVETADGRIHEYGATNDSRIDRAAGAATHAARTWALSRSRDRAGNAIDYRYTEDTASAAFRIAGIRYNGNPANGIAPSHEIVFTYENRPNQEVDAGFVAGMPVRQVVRLKRIDVRFNGTVLRRHELGYESALSSGGRSRLASIRECAASGSDCLAATVFAWQDGNAGFTDAAQVPIPIPAGYTASGRAGSSRADINGDGLPDLVWAGGASVEASTVHYRLGLADGQAGAAVNTGITARFGLGFPFDSNGDGRKDFLMRSASGNFVVARGTATGLVAPVDTGVAVPANLRDFGAADMNGDGLGDIVWSAGIGDPARDIEVRVHYARPAGGYAPSVSLYTQSAAVQYAEPEGGNFISIGTDLDGDGSQDLLMNENYTIARISASGYATDRFDSRFTGLVALNVNDDDCADYAYKHPTAQVLRIRLGSCSTIGSMSEIAGPAWTGNAYLQTHDWNGDGRTDLLLRGATNWMVTVSRGDGLSPIIDTGIPHLDKPTFTHLDLNGDGLHDLAIWDGNVERRRLRDGPLPDLLRSASDGFEVRAEFTYKSLVDPTVHVPGTGAVWPEQDVQANDSVVAQLRTTNGTGRKQLSATGFRYEGLRRNLLGRGTLGFRKLVQTDLSAAEPLSTETLQRLDWPFAGLPERLTLKRASGKTASTTEYKWAKLEWATGDRVRRFPYPSSITTRRFESGGPLDGAEVTRSVRTVAAIDAASGLVTDETVTTTEIAGGAGTGSSATLRILHAGVFNDSANWCLGRPQAVQMTASHTLPGGTAVTRSADQEWDGLQCRPTRIRLQPGDGQWQVTNNLSYDAFGNLAAEKVTGAAMAARTTSIAWDARGQLPVRVTNPLGHQTRYAWNAGTGSPKSSTDPNGSVIRWEYDAFGRLVRELQPDGTSSTWLREGCKGACDARIRYILRQDELDSAGVQQVSAFLDVDQHDRGFRLRTAQPGGGFSTTLVEFDSRGRVSASMPPHWSGNGAPPRWSFSYDELGRPRGASLRDVGGPVVRSLALDYQGLAVTTTDPLGRRATLTSTAWGPVARSEDPLGNATIYQHDAFGSLLRVRDALGNDVATVGYNARGMKTSVTDMDRGTWTWTRNALGETTSLRDGKGAVTHFQFDALGRVTRRSAPDGESSWTWGNTAAKRDIGRLVKVAGPGYNEEVTYDSVGRPATHKLVTDAVYTYGFSYNSLGLLNVLAFPKLGTGSDLRVAHDYTAGRLTRLRNANAPAEAWWTLNAQDAAGNPLDETLGAGLRVVSGYSPLTGEPEYRQSRGANGTVVQDLEWDWDAAGNLARRRDFTQSLTEDFSYDALDRLVASRRNGTTNLSIDYDALGNITRKSDICPGTVPCYAYHAQRRHVLVSAGGKNYAHDANGNMTSRAGAAITWSSDGLPLSIAHANGNSSQFSYGPAGNRWKQVAKQGSVTETTHYVGNALEKVVQGGVTTWRHYLPAPGGVAVQLRRSDTSAATMRYLTLDHLGSTDRITDAAGGIVAAGSFGAFGARRKADWTGVPTAAELAAMAAVTRDGFTGHEHVDNVELVHMNGRAYDPRLGRFISADPYVSMPHDGQGLNRYSYVLNNPLAFTDPSGFDPVPCLATQSGHCVQITVIAVSWAQYMRAAGGSHAAELASALERDPCGQNGSALACAMASGTLVSPSSIVLTVGRNADASLPGGGRFDAVRGFTARIANLSISSSPVALLFGADPDFQYFRVPDSAAGRDGAFAGNVGMLAGGIAGMARHVGRDMLAELPSAVARSFQGNPRYPGIDRFKDITLKKGTLIYAGFPGQSAFYTTASALRRSGYSASTLFDGLQVAAHKSKGLRTRVAAYEVVDDTPAAFALALANWKHGDGWLPQVVVPSYQTSLRFLGDFALQP